MTDLMYDLQRELVIRASRDIVFEFLTRSPQWAAWWGAGSTIDPHVGGAMYIRHPNGVEVRGEVLEVTPPERIVFTFGVPRQGSAAPANSRVTIDLHPHDDGTLVRLRHEFADADSRDQHVQGWRYQLSIFSNVVANATTANLAAVVDRWCAAWSTPDATARNHELERIAAPDIRFLDRFSTIAGMDDLRAHLAAVHRFMPGLRLERHGDIRHCQWHVLADWHAIGQDGVRRGSGTNAFVFDADGRISEVTGFWAANAES